MNNIRSQSQKTMAILFPIFLAVGSSFYAMESTPVWTQARSDEPKLHIQKPSAPKSVKVRLHTTPKLFRSYCFWRGLSILGTHLALILVIPRWSFRIRKMVLSDTPTNVDNYFFLNSGFPPQTFPLFDDFWWGNLNWSSWAGVVLNRHLTLSEKTIIPLVNHLLEHCS